MASTLTQIPPLGYGYWKIEPQQAADLTVEAYHAGYRHFDCASDYGNESTVGEGLARLFNEHGVERSSIWVTSKLWNTFHQADKVPEALDKTLNDLQLDYVDLYMIHFPIALQHVPISERYPAGWFFDPDADTPIMHTQKISIHETWKAMENLQKSGLVRQLGVCNMNCSLLRELCNCAEIQPSVLQVEMHPRLAQSNLLRFAQESGIAVTAFSPLGAQSYTAIDMADEHESLLIHSVIKSIAQRSAMTPAQVILCWAVQRGTSVVTKTVRPERMRENIAAKSFTLTDQDMLEIDALNTNRRFNDPAEFCESAFNTFFPIFD